MTRVLVAMSGGVDSSVAAALLRAEGHEVVGVTMRVWGGESDSGCCSVSDVDDARRVADHLGIEHHVFNFADDFDRLVVAPYVASHAAGLTPNPCIECNRHLKFDRLLARAGVLGFDAVATGHHARVLRQPDGTRRVARGADRAKDQSYVLHMLDQAALARTLLPLGDMHKSQVRARAADLGLRTASKPDSQEVCFIRSDTGRARFLGDRIPLHPGRVVDGRGRTQGTVEAVELVTVGQRRGLGVTGGSEPVYALHVDVPSATVLAGAAHELLVDEQATGPVSWAGRPVAGSLAVQVSAHAAPRSARVAVRPDGSAVVRWDTPQRRVAPGQSVVFYDGDTVVGGAPAAPVPTP